jgi:hypothetical protein
MGQTYYLLTVGLNIFGGILPLPIIHQKRLFFIVLLSITTLCRVYEFQVAVGIA